MQIEFKGNKYFVTNEMTIAQMLKNGGVEITEPPIKVVVPADSEEQEMPQVKKISRRIKR